MQEPFNFGKLNFYRRLEAQKVRLQQALESVCSVPTVLKVEEKEFYDVQSIINEWYDSIEKKQEEVYLAIKERIEE